MKIKNAKIEGATINFFNSGDDLQARMRLVQQDGYRGMSFSMANPLDVQRLMKLREWLGAKKIEHLNGQIVRIVESEQSFGGDHFEGVGHAIEDRFIYCGYKKDTTEVKELTQSELKDIIDKSHGIVHPEND